MTKNTPETFWARVQKSETCWKWTGSKNNSGYGQLSYQRRMTRAHRLAWELTHGPIPKGLSVCHHCDTPLCCRPEHLFLGTAYDNSRDCYLKGRTAGHGYPNHPGLPGHLRRFHEEREARVQRLLAEAVA